MMSNAIQFLESMGANAAMARMAAVEFEAAIDSLDVDADAKLALKRRDVAALNRLLDGRPIMLCAIAAPRDEPEPEENAPGEEQEGEDGKQAE